jgi:hypothetical protein
MPHPITPHDMAMARIAARSYIALNSILYNEVESAAMLGLTQASIKYDQAYGYPWRKYSLMCVNNHIKECLRNEHHYGLTGCGRSHIPYIVSYDTLIEREEQSDCDEYAPSNNRDQTTNRDAMLTALTSPDPSPEDVLLYKERLELFLSYVEQFEDATYFKLVAVLLYGCQVADVARLTDSAPETLSVLLAYHRPRLKVYMDQHYNDNKEE